MHAKERQHSRVFFFFWVLDRARVCSGHLSATPPALVYTGGAVVRSLEAVADVGGARLAPSRYHVHEVVLEEEQGGG